MGHGSTRMNTDQKSDFYHEGHEDHEVEILYKRFFTMKRIEMMSIYKYFYVMCWNPF
jgi:hypothetical protein